MKKQVQRQRIVNSLRLVWASLESHLDLAEKDTEQMCESCGTRKFHAEAVKEYAYVIHVLSEFL